MEGREDTVFMSALTSGYSTKLMQNAVLALLLFACVEKPKDQVQVDCKDPLMGWLKWKEGNKILIDIFLMP
jgi:hypothetical protein